MNSMVICLIIFAVMIILFFNRKIPMAFTSMGVIVALYVAGCVDKATVFAGFGNNNVLTMAGMFIVAHLTATPYLRVAFAASTVTLS